MLTHPRVGYFIKSYSISMPRFNFLAGWQYLFQPEYRKLTHDRWRNEGNISIAIQILGSVLGMGLSGLFAAFAVMAAWTLI